MATNPRVPLVMDNDNQVLGNSPGQDLRGRLHTKVANTAAEAIPVYQTSGATQTAVISNVALAGANVEVAVSIPVNAKSFELRLREIGRLKIAFAEGETSTGPWLTIGQGGSFSTQVPISQAQIFVSPSLAGATLELVAFV